MENPLNNFLDKKKAEYEKYHDKIITMLGNQEGYGFAESTLEGILYSIEAKGDISLKQKEAIDNIYNSIF